jgi:hypothetical protein
MSMVFLRITQIIILLSLCAALLPGCSSAPVKPETAAPGDYEYTRQYLSWLIRKEMKSNNITGLSMALVDDQRVVWAEGFIIPDMF